MTKVALANYGAVASEYYDSVRHPTCDNFRAASRQLLQHSLIGLTASSDWICEVGPGRSLVAELLPAYDRLILIDSVAPMLGYSREYHSRGAHLLLGEAGSLPLRTDSCDILVASLGDPYNESQFWRRPSPLHNAIA